MKTEECFEYNKRHDNRSILLAIFWNSKNQLLKSCALRLLMQLLEFASTWYFRCLINYVQSSDKSGGFGLVLVFGIGAIRGIQSVVQKIHSHAKSRFNTKMHSFLLNLINQKALRLSQFVSWSEESIQQLMLDAQPLVDSITDLHELTTIPMSVCLCLLWLFDFFGSAMIKPLSLVLGLSALRSVLILVEYRLEGQYESSKENTLSYVSDKLKNISLIKLYSWEDVFIHRIIDLRCTESRKALIFSIVSILQNILADFAPFIVQTACLLSMHYSSPSYDKLNTANVFFYLFLIRELMRSIDSVPEAYADIKRARDYSSKLGSFLSAEEAGSVETSAHSAHYNQTGILNGDFKWNAECLSAVLSNVTLTVPSGQLTCVVSETGQGKSAFLYSIIRETQMTSGYVMNPGSCALAPQQTWIKSGTFRENILLQQKFDKTRYDLIIESCALKLDLSRMEAGDETLFYGRLPKISGGQKQRLGIARAAYHDMKLYLFDDCLSMLDARTADHVFENVISDNGILNGKTRIFATHNVKYLKHAKRVIVVHDGSVRMMDPQSYIAESRNVIHKKKDDLDGSQPDSGLLQKRHSSKWRNFADFYCLDHRSHFSRETLKIINCQLSLLRYWPLLIGLAGFTIGQGLKIKSDFSLADWIILRKFDNYFAAECMQLYIYSNIAECIVLLISSVYSVFQLRRFFDSLHQNIIYSLLTTSLSFYTKKPLTKIIDRLSDSYEQLDIRFPSNLKHLFANLANVLTSIVISLIACPAFALPLALVIALSSYFRSTYLSIKLRRAKKNAYAQILNNLAETTEGRVSVRSYQIVKECMDEFQLSVEQYNETCLRVQQATDAFNIKLNLMVSALIMVLSTLAVFGFVSLEPAFFSLLLKDVLSVDYYMELVSKSWQETQKFWIAYEKVKKYATLVKEDRCDSRHEHRSVEDSHIPMTLFHVKSGHIRFKDFTARYQNSSLNVLNRINLDILPGQKLGVVGRTGAGKSSLSLALLGLLEQVEGSLTIDGVDIRHVNLPDLRSNITLITQEPLLLNDTVRNNIDPRGKYPDEYIWNVLEFVRLKNIIFATKDRLEEVIGGKHLNLSRGERQLLCFVRALLKNSKVLILDEVTASLDVRKEAIVLDALKLMCFDSTIITIAHKIQNVRKHDCIIVMENGSIVEQGAFDILMANDKSIFWDLYHKSITE